MNDPDSTLEEILETLTTLRSKNETGRKFPQDTWDSIIRLTKVFPLDVSEERTHLD